MTSDSSSCPRHTRAKHGFFPQAIGQANRWVADIVRESVVITDLGMPHVDKLLNKPPT
jgi:hypothetical protein